MKQVFIYADGACLGNPGPGGWGTILVYGENEKELSGYEVETTNNRMELLAVINGFAVLKQQCIVTVVSDSQYVTEAFNKGWIEQWKKQNFKDRKNADLWKILLGLIQSHKVTFEWIKGHAGHEYNERCDTLAVEQAKIAKREIR